MSESFTHLVQEIESIKSEIQSIKEDLKKDVHPALKLIAHYFRIGSLPHMQKLTEDERENLEDIVLRIEEHVRH
ncbi:MAG: hypothetical protein SFU25_03570 [Candidatus Caenarcaniphilales bacterium]|nr:hypothetical protein [Candidatus Caenarcaniphilales bacterium]